MGHVGSPFRCRLEGRQGVKTDPAFTTAFETSKTRLASGYGDLEVRRVCEGKDCNILFLDLDPVVSCSLKNGSLVAPPR